MLRVPANELDPLATQPHYLGPLLTRALADALHAGRASGAVRVLGSFDLGRTLGEATIVRDGWEWHGQHFPWPDGLKDRTVYFWDGTAFAPLQRYTDALIKLVPTDWGTPTFEIDGIKMLVSAQISPYADAQRKVALVQPRGKQVLDTCGGLGYFAACCLADGAAQVQSYEKNADVLWLRRHNPWSPDPDDRATGGRLRLTHADVALAIGELPDQSFDAVLHDPPRFGIAGELYAQTFYDQLARLLRMNGRLFHYTGSPNRKTSGRDVPTEVARRLAKSGFATERALDGVYAVKSTHPTRT
ncbi:MAG: SAM-dependent methyltransferase [Rhodanobacteraceae bacterium]|nr:SAM-dependent methyltransferase [Rhodanobacteraceae bacterium]MBK7043572.1 SAM-dependent methyltransferase [Rhodanobacteraceae bacterium]MBP9154943.1 SAM-dependent methyltransferase [Xanthomonadales bacterium]HQW81762.1 SAM-dependent methyltransferase [Pseudomonadota bacterium]